MPRTACGLPSGASKAVIVGAGIHYVLGTWGTKLRERLQGTSAVTNHPLVVHRYIHRASIHSRQTLPLEQAKTIEPHRLSWTNSALSSYSHLRRGNACIHRRRSMRVRQCDFA